MGYRGYENALAATVRDRAVGVDRPPFGYRRRPVTIRHEGWSLTVPGSFGERWTSEEWWGGESKRTITLAATATEAEGGPMPPEAFLAQGRGGPRRPHDHPPRRAGHGSGQDHDRCELGRRSRRRRGVLGRRRQRSRDPHRVRRPIRLGVGHRHVALAQVRVSRGSVRLASADRPVRATDRPISAGRASWLRGGGPACRSRHPGCGGRRALSRGWLG